MKGEAERIARGLSEAQRSAITFGHPTPHGNVFCVGGIRTQQALAGMQLVTGYANACFLTALGKAVRAYIQEQQQ